MLEQVMLKWWFWLFIFLMSPFIFAFFATIITSIEKVINTFLKLFKRKGK